MSLRMTENGERIVCVAQLQPQLTHKSEWTLVGPAGRSVAELSLSSLQQLVVVVESGGLDVIQGKTENTHTARQ